MKVTKHNYQTIELTDKERDAIDLVDKLLYEFQSNMSDKLYLESQISGETIEVRELGRVRGVLGFFQTDGPQIFTVEEL